MNSNRSYTDVVLRLIQAGELSPAARDMRPKDVLFQLEQSGASWAVYLLRSAIDRDLRWAGEA